jgi:hypothetical protein
MDVLIRKSWMRVSFQWPKECLDFVDKIREEVYKMARNEYYRRVRPVMVEGRVFLKASSDLEDGRKKVRGG